MRENRTYGSEGGESSNGYSPTPISWALFSEGDQGIERLCSSIDLADPNSNGYHVSFDLGIDDVEESIALVIQDDVGQLLILLVQNMRDRLIIKQVGRAVLGGIAHSFGLILYFVLQL